MTGKEFIAAMDAAADMEILGVTANGQEVVVRNSDMEESWAFAIDDLRDNTPEGVLAIARKQRQPRIMSTYSRIVGYYSRLDNWNRSKLAEAVDRRKGDYAIPEEVS